MSNPSNAAPSPVPALRERPRVVGLVAAVQGLQGLALVLAAGLPMVLSPDATIIADSVLLTRAAEGGLLAAALLLLVGAVGLWRLRPWSWQLAMAGQGLALAQALFDYWHGDADYLSMALSATIALMLNQAEVRAAFRTQDDD